MPSRISMNTTFIIDLLLLEFCLALSMVLILISSVMSLAALAKPEKALKLDSAGNPIKNKFLNVNLFTKRKHSPVYEVEMFILMVSQLLRSRQYNAPIFIAIVGGIPADSYIQG